MFNGLMLREWDLLEMTLKALVEAGVEVEQDRLLDQDAIQ